MMIRTAYGGRAAFLTVVLLSALSRGVSAQAVTELAIPANDMVYDPVSARLYASVPGRAGSNGNSIAVINPTTRTVEQYVWVGSEPNQLALSDDGKYLYVGLDGAYAVRRVDLTTRSAGLLFSLGTSRYEGQLAAAALAVLPGDPSSVAVVRKSPWANVDDGVAIFTDGVMRPKTTAGGYEARLLAFSASSSRLYGYNNSDSGADVYQLTVDAAGVSKVYSAPYLLDPFQREMIVDHGALYASSGEVINAESLAGIGRFSLPAGVTEASGVVVDRQRGRCYMLFRSSFIRAYALDTFTVLWDVPVTLPSPEEPSPGLVQWAPTGLAYRTRTKVVFVDLTDRNLLAVFSSGNGSGRVQSQPPGVECGEWCAAFYPTGTSVKLTVTPSSGSRFVGWEGPPDCSDGLVSVTETTGCTAVFAQLTGGRSLQLPLKANDLAYSPLTGRLYASIPGSDLARGNTITVIDPQTGAIGPSVWVGSEPNRMAISRDGETLWVGLDGATAVRRVDLATLTAGLQFQVGRRVGDGRLIARSLAVAPGDAASVAVARVGQHGNHVGVAFYTNGIQQGRSTGYAEGSQGLVFSDSPTRLFGLDDYDSANFVRMNVSPDGVSVDSAISLGMAHGGLRFAQGRLYLGSGQVVEPESGTIVGTFPTGWGSLVAPNASDGLVYAARLSYTGSYFVDSYDPVRFTLVRSGTVPGAIGILTALAATGNAGVALTTDSGQLFLVNLNLPAVHTVTVKASDPPDGLMVSVDPADQDGLGAVALAGAAFRTYQEGTVVTLTAPTTVGTAVFSLWMKDGVSFSTNPSITFTVDSPAVYSVVYRYPAPTVLGLAPTVGPDTGGTVVRITGTNFRPGVRVGVGGYYASGVVLVDATTITATTPPRAPGLVWVSVTNPDGQSHSLASAFTYAPTPGAFAKTKPLPGSGNRPTSLTLTWAPSAAATNYEYCVDATDDSQCDGNAWVSTGTATTSGPLALALHTRYYWQVRATTPYGSADAAGGWWTFSTGISPLGLSHVAGDLDGDRIADLTLWRPSVGLWYSLKSGHDYRPEGVEPVQWGTQLAGDRPVPGDYDGDGRMDYAFWRPATGTWWVRFSSTNYTTYLARQWGMEAAGDVPTPGDYDGDGKADLAFWRPAAGTWWVLLSGANYTTYFSKQWGTLEAGDLPTPGDYDGDGRTDLAFWRPAAGAWWVLLSSSEYATYRTRSWGTQAAGDIPIPGDYDNDGLTDFAFWRPSTGTWWALKSSAGYTAALSKQWGTRAAGDIPVPADYDGDGATDMAFWRPGTGSWWILQSTGSFATYVVRHWSADANDVPVTGQ